MGKLGILLFLVLVQLQTAFADGAPDPLYFYTIGGGSGTDLSVEGLKFAWFKYDEARAWRVVPTRTGSFHLVNAKTGDTRCLAVVNGRLAMAARSDVPAQLWTVKQEGDNCTFTNVGTQQVLQSGPAAGSPASVGPLPEDERWRGELHLVKYRRVSSPLPDYANNLYLNDLDGQKTGRNAGGLWRVIVPVLEVRAAPDAAAKIVHRYKRGDIIEANIGRGGAEEVKNNAIDGATGNTWMPVWHIYHGPYDWYVRASKKNLQPVMARRK